MQMQAKIVRPGVDSPLRSAHARPSGFRVRGGRTSTQSTPRRKRRNRASPDSPKARGGKPDLVDFVDCVDCVDRAAEPRDSGLAAVAGWGPRHGTVAGLDDQHAVAVAVEAVALADGLGVGGEDALAPGEGGDHHQQR